MASDARSWERFALASIAGGAALRAVFGLLIHPPLNYVYSDMQGYVTRAVRLADGVTLNRFDTFFPPGTHIVLALPLRIFGTGRTGMWAASVLLVLISCAVPLLAWRCATRLMTPKAAAITAFLTAFWPLYVIYGGFFLSEIPSVAGLLLTLWLAFRVRETDGRRRILFALAAGASAGAALAIRPQLVLNIAIAAVTMLGVRRSVRVAGAAALGLVVPLAAVLALNANAAGRFVGISENGGLNFFQGHCPVNSVRTEKSGVGVLEFGSPVVEQLNRGREYFFYNHIAWEQSFFVRQGLDCIRADGLGHLTVLARNVADLGITSVPWPPSVERGLRRFVRPANLAISWLLPSLMVAGVALARSRRAAAGHPMLLVAHLLCVFPTAVVFYGDPRFRVPYDVFVLGLFAILLVTFTSRHDPDRIETP
jgi:4-amino-4-deoxy-L-arabinose transferase-like glycosyltransferase